MGEPRAATRQVRSARMVIVRVLMLDGTYYETQIDKRAVGVTLFDTVCDSVDLLEKDYFGLSFSDPSLPGIKLWLNHEKKISKQMKGLPWEFAFEVKFYPGDPQQLHEDLTRYQLCLQLRNDIVCGKLPCSVVTYTLLGSYTVQSELGDFDVEEYGPGIEYLKEMQFAPNQDRELLQKIAELHKTHRGQTPEEAELHFLENAKKLALYGVQLQDAKDAFGVDIQIGVCASGIIIFQDRLQINKFVWPKVIKMSYRRSKFYVKLRAGEFEDFQSQIGFRLLNVKLAKILWKICVEHHSFFRFRESDAPKKRGLFPRFGSTFRYSGRTMYQTRTAMAFSDRPSPYFDRVHSKRATYHGKTANRSLDDEMYKRRPPRETEPPPPPRPQYIDDNHYPQKRHPVDEPEYSDHEKEGYVSEDDSPMDRKSRMEKIHAVPTPLSMVLTREEREHHENNVDEPPRYNHRSDDEDSLPDKRRHDDDEDVMVRKYNSYSDNFIHHTNSGKRVLHDIDITAINPVKKLNVSFVDKSCVKNDSRKIIGRRKMVKKTGSSNTSTVQNCPSMPAESNKRQSRYIKKNTKTSPSKSDRRSSLEALQRQVPQNIHTSQGQDSNKESQGNNRKRQWKSLDLDYNENQWNSSKQYLKDTYTVKKGLRSDSLSQDDESPLSSSTDHPQIKPRDNPQTQKRKIPQTKQRENQQSNPRENPETKQREKQNKLRENPQIEQRENLQVKERDDGDHDLLPWKHNNDKQFEHQMSDRSDSKCDTSDSKNSNLYKYNSLSNVDIKSDVKVTNLYVPKKRQYTSMQDFSKSPSLTDRNRLEICMASAGSSLDSLSGQSPNRIYTYSSDDSSDIGGSSLVVGEKYVCDSSYQTSTSSLPSEHGDYSKGPPSVCDRSYQISTSSLPSKHGDYSKVLASVCDRARIKSDSSLEMEAKSSVQEHIKIPKTTSPNLECVSAVQQIPIKSNVTGTPSDNDINETKYVSALGVVVDKITPTFTDSDDSENVEGELLNREIWVDSTATSSKTREQPHSGDMAREKDVTSETSSMRREQPHSGDVAGEISVNHDTSNDVQKQNNFVMCKPGEGTNPKPKRVTFADIENDSQDQSDDDELSEYNDYSINVNENHNGNEGITVPEINCTNSVLDSSRPHQKDSVRVERSILKPYVGNLSSIDNGLTVCLAVQEHKYDDDDDDDDENLDIVLNKQSDFFTPTDDNVYSNKPCLTKIDKSHNDFQFGDFDLIGYSAEPKRRDVRKYHHSYEDEGLHSPVIQSGNDLDTDITEDISTEVKTASASIKVMLEKFKSGITETESEISDVASGEGQGSEFIDSKRNVPHFVDDEMNVLTDSKNIVQDVEINKVTDEEIHGVTHEEVCGVTEITDVDNIPGVDGENFSSKVLSNNKTFVSDILTSDNLDHNEGIHNRGNIVTVANTSNQNINSLSKFHMSDIKLSPLTSEHDHHQSSNIPTSSKSEYLQFNILTSLEPQHHQSNKISAGPEPNHYRSNTALEPQHHQSNKISAGPEPDHYQSNTALEPTNHQSNKISAAPEPKHHQFNEIYATSEPDHSQTNVSSSAVEPQHHQSNISFAPGESLSVKMLQTSKVSIEHGSKVSILHEEKTYSDNATGHMPFNYSKTVTKVPVHKTVRGGSSNPGTNSQPKHVDTTDSSGSKTDLLSESSPHLTTVPAFQADVGRQDYSSSHTSKSNSNREKVDKSPRLCNTESDIDYRYGEFKRKEDSLSISSLSKPSASPSESLFMTPVIPECNPLPAQQTSISSLPVDNVLPVELPVTDKDSEMFSSVGKLRKLEVEKPGKTSSMTSSPMASSFVTNQPSYIGSEEEKPLKASSMISSPMSSSFVASQPFYTESEEEKPLKASSMTSFSASQPSLSVFMGKKNSNSTTSLSDVRETNLGGDLETNLLEHPQRTTCSISSSFSLSQPSLSLLRSKPDVGVSSESLNDFSNDDKPGNIHLTSRFGSTPVLSYSESKYKKPILSKAWQTGQSHRTPRPLTFNPKMRYSSGSCTSLRDKTIPEETALDKLKSSHLKVKQKTSSGEGHSPTHTGSLLSMATDPTFSITPSLTNRLRHKTSLVNTTSTSAITTSAPTITSSMSAITNYNLVPSVQSISAANSGSSCPSAIYNVSNYESTVYTDAHVKHDTIPVVMKDTFTKMSYCNTSPTNSLMSPLCSTGVPHQSMSPLCSSGVPNQSLSPLCSSGVPNQSQSYIVPDQNTSRNITSSKETEHKSLQDEITSPMATVSHNAVSSDPPVFSVSSTSDFVNMNPNILPDLHNSSSSSSSSALTTTRNLSSSSSSSSSSSFCLPSSTSSTSSVSYEVCVSSSSPQQSYQTQKVISKSVRFKTPEISSSTTRAYVLETQPSCTPMSSIYKAPSTTPACEVVAQPYISSLHTASSTSSFCTPYSTSLPFDHKIPSSSTSTTAVSKTVMSYCASNATMLTEPSDIHSSVSTTMSSGTTSSSYCKTGYRPYNTSSVTMTTTTASTPHSTSTVTSITSTIPQGASTPSLQMTSPSIYGTQSSTKISSLHDQAPNTSAKQSSPKKPSSLHYEPAPSSPGELDNDSKHNQKQRNKTHVMYYDNSFDKMAWSPDVSLRMRTTEPSQTEGKEIHSDIQVPDIKITPSDDDTPFHYFNMTQSHQGSDLLHRNIGGTGHGYNNDNAVDQPSETLTDDKDSKTDTKESSCNRLDVNAASKSHIWKRTKTKQKFIQAIWAKVNSERVDSDMEESDKETEKMLANVTSVDSASKSVLSKDTSTQSLSSGSMLQQSTRSDTDSTNTQGSDGCYDNHIPDDDNQVTLGDVKHTSEAKSQPGLKFIEPVSENKTIQSCNIDRRTRTTDEDSPVGEQPGNVCNHDNKDNQDDKCSTPGLKKDENGNDIKHNGSTLYGERTKKIMLKIKSSFGLSEDEHDGSHICRPDDLHFLSELVLAIIIMVISIIFLVFDVV